MVVPSRRHLSKSSVKSRDWIHERPSFRAQLAAASSEADKLHQGSAANGSESADGCESCFWGGGSGSTGLVTEGGASNRQLKARISQTGLFTHGCGDGGKGGAEEGDGLMDGLERRGRRREKMGE